MRASSSLVLSLATIVLALSSLVTASGAQDFYRGKSVTLFAGQPPGGGIDSEMRLVGQFFGRHIAGEPTIVPRNLPGAGGMIGVPDLTLQRALGVLLAPAAWLLGVPWADAGRVGALIGLKTVLNEFLAYQALAAQITAGALGARSAVIASYALCGFANFGSLAIMIGGIGGLAPERRGEVVELGLRSIVSGTLASFSTACVAGMLL